MKKTKFSVPHRLIRKGILLLSNLKNKFLGKKIVYKNLSRRVTDLAKRFCCIQEMSHMIDFEPSIGISAY
jgi:hypothetical protein